MTDGRGHDVRQRRGETDDEKEGNTSHTRKLQTQKHDDRGHHDWRARSLLLLSLYFATASPRHHQLVRPFPPHSVIAVAAAAVGEDGDGAPQQQQAGRHRRGSTAHDQEQEAEQQQEGEKEQHKQRQSPQDGDKVPSSEHQEDGSERDFDALHGLLSSLSGVHDPRTAPIVRWMEARVQLLPSSFSTLPVKLREQVQQVKSHAFCFRVKDQAQNDGRWKQLAAEHGTTWALHGTRMEHLYSILNHGFCGALNKRCMGRGRIAPQRLQCAKCSLQPPRHRPTLLPLWVPACRVSACARF